MIIENQQDVTTAVLAEMHRTPDPRTKEILTALVIHLHGFVRDVGLTEREFQAAVGYLVELGQRTTPSHNEVMLICGALGVSNLVALLNNGGMGTRPTQANNLGPFWRAEAPRVENGGSLLRSPTAGEPIVVRGWVRDEAGQPVAGADVDVWHSSTVGLYENQDPTQADWNLRGRLTTDAAGGFSFRSVKPSGYPVPIDGPAGVMLNAQRRHNMRPAHLHFLIYKPGFKTVASQIYVADDPYLETDSQFGVTRALIGEYVRHDGGTDAPGAGTDAPGAGTDAPGGAAVWWSLEHSFTLEPGESRLPRAPITGKAQAPA